MPGRVVPDGLRRRLVYLDTMTLLLVRDPPVPGIPAGVFLTLLWCLLLRLALGGGPAAASPSPGLTAPEKPSALPSGQT